MIPRILPLSNRRRHHVPGVAALLLVSASVWLLWEPESYDFGFRFAEVADTEAEEAKPAPMTLPDIEALEAAGDEMQQSEFCSNRFSLKFLNDMRDSTSQYCDTQSSSAPARLTCFHSHTHSSGDYDSACIGQGAVLDTNLGMFRLDCHQKRPSKADSDVMVPLVSLKDYWYNTGPGYIMRNFVSIHDNDDDLDEEDKTPKTLQDASTNKTPDPVSDGDNAVLYILMKREGFDNVWHSLMEIWSAMMSVDVLRISNSNRNKSRPQIGELRATDEAYDEEEEDDHPLFDPAMDRNNTQVVILDDGPDGTFFPLWNIISGRPPIRLRDLIDQHSSAMSSRSSATVDNESPTPPPPTNILLPLAGAANPIWQNDWVDSDCTDSSTLKVFIQRILETLGLNAPIPIPLSDRDGRSPPLVLTFVDRQGTRKLRNQGALLDAVAGRFPRNTTNTPDSSSYSPSLRNDSDEGDVEVTIQVVDLAALPFSKQIQVIQTTDILVGVHGAGLTHEMFLAQSGSNNKNGSGTTAAKAAAAAAALVEIQPRGMTPAYYKGFENMARMLGHGYVRAVGEVFVEPTLGEEESPPPPDWHFADITIEEGDFVEAVVQALGAVKAGRLGRGAQI